MVKGYAQQFGVDFFETFASVARLDTIKMFLALAAHKGWKIHQLDVKSAFLNGMLEEEVFVDQRKGFVKLGNESKVCLLKKALYGLKQVPRAWYIRVYDYFLSLGFKRSLSEPTLYVRSANNELLIVSLYVDALLVTSSCKNQIGQFRLQMMEEF